MDIILKIQPCTPIVMLILSFKSVTFLKQMQKYKYFCVVWFVFLLLNTRRALNYFLIVLFCMKH